MKQGMYMEVFSKVYYDRVYFLRAVRSSYDRVRFQPPSGTPRPFESLVPPSPGRKSKFRQGLKKKVAQRGGGGGGLRHIFFSDIFLRHLHYWVGVTYAYIPDRPPG